MRTYEERNLALYAASESVAAHGAGQLQESILAALRKRAADTHRRAVIAQLGAKA